jgi:hypothetical protein
MKLGISPEYVSQPFPTDVGIMPLAQKQQNCYVCNKSNVYY